MSDKYISVDEYLMDRAKLEDLSSEIVGNINTLIPRINQLLEKFGQKKDVNSGLRLLLNHLETYKKINEDRKAKGLSEIPVPMGSKHLVGAAIDLEDKDRTLTQFCMDHLDLLQDLGLWMENPSYCSTWVHLQIFPPKSGNRVFNPY